jgi:hypothetical protein
MAVSKNEGRVRAGKAKMADLTLDQKREAMRPVNEARSRASRERRIAELIAKAPPLTAEQRARLAVLLNGGQDQAVAS